MVCVTIKTILTFHIYNSLPLLFRNIFSSFFFLLKKFSPTDPFLHFLMRLHPFRSPPHNYILYILWYITDLNCLLLLSFYSLFSLCFLYITWFPLPSSVLHEWFASSWRLGVFIVHNSPIEYSDLVISFLLHLCFSEFRVTSSV